MVMITVAAALMIVPYVLGLFGTLTAGGPSNLITTTEQMNIPGTYNNYGIISITLTDRASSAIQGVSFDCVSAAFASANCNGLVMTIGGSIVTVHNPLLVGQTATGSGFVQASTTFAAGTTYTIVVTVTFITGSTTVFAVNVPSYS